jgi:hypothetical protein
MLMTQSMCSDLFRGIYAANLQCHMVYFVNNELVNHLTYITIKALKIPELFGISGYIFFNSGLFSFY